MYHDSGKDPFYTFVPAGTFFRKEEKEESLSDLPPNSFKYLYPEQKPPPIVPCSTFPPCIV
jgi:hypothetical protein